MAKKEDKPRFEEARELFSNEKKERVIEKDVFQDKFTGQISLRLPKDICLSKRINKNSKFGIIINPKKETWDELKEEDLIIRLIKKK
ncbi:hypothetical protein KAJ87_01605 [Candidatus Pacearchaeota archaeon]|nr:hypothetical protein [Candidatus Pacearchaeota archaeon]